MEFITRKSTNRAEVSVQDEILRGVNCARVNSNIIDPNRVSKIYNIISPIWKSGDSNYSPIVQSMLLELNFNWYFAASIEEQNLILKRAGEIRKGVDSGIGWWIDKASKINSAAGDEFCWFLGGTPSSIKRDEWLEMNQWFQSDLKIEDDKTLASGMFIAGLLMPGPGSGEAKLFKNGIKSWIKHETYNEVRETLGEKGVEKFINAMRKGFVRAKKENGIKMLGEGIKMLGEGINYSGKIYKYELKIFGTGTSHYRILGNFDEKTGHIIFEKFINLK